MQTDKLAPSTMRKPIGMLPKEETAADSELVREPCPGSEANKKTQFGDSGSRAFRLLVHTGLAAGTES
jgi:hypothetical protein